MSTGSSNTITLEKYQELDNFIDSLADTKGALISVLHKAQSIFGYLPREVQRHIGEKLDIPSAKVNGVVTFYSFFTEVPKGEHLVQICMGTACFVRGAEGILSMLEQKLQIKAGQTTADGKFSIDALRCIGACGLAPVMMVDGKVYGRLTTDQIDKILSEYK